MEPYTPAAAERGDTPELTQLPEDGDPFARTRVVLEEMISRLASGGLLQATQDAVEDYVTGTGRELQRQLLQDHLDLRAALEDREPEVTGGVRFLWRDAAA